jgi:hypothetical protein
MKYLVAILAAIGYLHAAPTVSNVQASITNIADNGKGMKTRSFTVTFDLANTNGQACRVWPGVRGLERQAVLEDEGPYLFYKNVAGDTATMAGTGKQLTFTVADTAGEFDNVRVKVMAWDREGWPPFPNLPYNPRHHAWSLDIRRDSVATKSPDVMTYLKADEVQHDYFLSVMVEFPIFPVMGNHVKNAITISDCSNSDCVPIPVPHTSLGDPYSAYAEGYPVANDGDRHLEVVDVENWQNWSMYNAVKVSDPQNWQAAGESYWNFKSDTLPYLQAQLPWAGVKAAVVRSYRPIGWTSTDAAGLSVTAGTIRLDEVAEGEIHHAMRTTVRSSYNSFVYPASHMAGGGPAYAPPMGMRWRLKASYDISSHCPLQGSPGSDLYKTSRGARIVLRALQKYGMINADNAGTGFDLYLMSERDDNTELKWADVWGTSKMSNTVPMDASIINNFYALTHYGVLDAGLTLDDFEVVDWSWQVAQYTNYKSKQ